MSRRVLVSGANGFIGRRLCLALQRRGDRVIALLRRPPEAPGPWDVWRLADLTRPLPADIAADAGVVCHLAALVHARGADARAYEAVNHQGTCRLLDAAARAGVDRFLYFSSVKAAGETTPGCVDESHPARPETPYGRSKLAAERAVAAAGAIPSRVNLRLSPVYGDRMAGSLRQLVRAARQGWLPPLPAVDNRRSFIHVDDLVTAVLALIDAAPVGCELACVSDDAPLSTPAIVAAAGRRRSSWHTPLWAWRGLARLGDTLAGISGRAAPFDHSRYRALFEDACYRNHRLRALAGWSPRWTLERFLRERA